MRNPLGSKNGGEEGTDTDRKVQLAGGLPQAVKYMAKVALT